MWRQSSSIYSIIVHLNIGLSTTQHKNTCKLSNLGSYFGFTMIISMCMSLLIHIKILHFLYLIYGMKGQHSLNKSLHFLNHDNYFPTISLIDPCLSIIFKVQISLPIIDCITVDNCKWLQKGNDVIDCVDGCCGKISNY